MSVLMVNLGYDGLRIPLLGRTQLSLLPRLLFLLLKTHSNPAFLFLSCSGLIPANLGLLNHSLLVIWLHRQHIRTLDRNHSLDVRICLQGVLWFEVFRL